MGVYTDNQLRDIRAAIDSLETQQSDSSLIRLDNVEVYEADDNGKPDDRLGTLVLTSDGSYVFASR